MRIALSTSGITRIQAVMIAAIIIVAAIAGAVYYATLSTPETTPSEIAITTNVIWDIVDIDPMGPAMGTGSGTMRTNLYDALIYPSIAEGYLPWVAESWEVAPDGMSYTFNITHGIKFHDGTELKAEDVAWTMNRALVLGTGYSTLWTPYVNNAEVVDDYTVRFNMKKTLGPIFYTLTVFFVMNKDLVMSNILTTGAYGEYGDYGKDFLRNHDAGSGAYKLKTLKPDEEMVMERFDDYWNEVNPKAPHEVRYISLTDPVTIRVMMEKGELTFTDPFQSTENLELMDKIPGVEIYANPYHYYIQFMLHNQKAPTDDIHVRKAMALAINKKAIEAQVMGSTAMDGLIPIWYPGYSSAFVYPYDIQLAQEEIKKSEYYGHLNEYPVEFHYVEGVGDSQKAGLMVKLWLEETLGMVVNVVPTPWTKVLDETANIDRAPQIGYWGPGPAYTEAGDALAKFHSSQAKTINSNEWLLDPEVDAIVEDAIGTINQTLRFEKYAALHMQLMEQCILIPSIAVSSQNAYNADVIKPAPAYSLNSNVYNYEYRLWEVLQ